MNENSQDVKMAFKVLALSILIGFVSLLIRSSFNITEKEMLADIIIYVLIIFLLFLYLFAVINMYLNDNYKRISYLYDLLRGSIGEEKLKEINEIINNK